MGVALHKKIFRRLKTAFTTLYHRLVYYKLIKLKYPEFVEKGPCKKFYRSIERVIKFLDTKNCLKTVKQFSLNAQYQNPKIVNTKILWHQDSQKTKECSCSKFFHPFEFYADCYARWTKSTKPNTCKVDLRFIWEASRLQFLIPQLLISQDPLFVQNATKTIQDWNTQNPFLQGPNWICAMEVAIRAINIIFILCQEQKICPGAFVNEGIYKLLWEHKTFVEQKLEYFDRPNNHLLCDLLGLVYLNCFFDQKKEAFYKLNILTKELELQVQSDGSLGEGSTGYHALVYELVVHGIGLAMAFELGEDLLERLERLERKMLSFLQATQLLKLGDFDGGIIFAGVEKTLKKTTSIEQFKDFGLIVARQEKGPKIPQINIALKTGHNCKDLPSGHFHQNILAFNLTIENTKIFDNATMPFYTKSKPIRDFGRSIQAYTTFGCKHWIKKAQEWPEFWSDLKILGNDQSVAQNSSKITINASFSSNLCHPKDSGQCNLERSIKTNNNNGFIEIEDRFFCPGLCSPIWFFVTPLAITGGPEEYTLAGLRKKFSLRSSINLCTNYILTASNYGAPAWTGQLSSTQEFLSDASAKFTIFKI